MKARTGERGPETKEAKEEGLPLKDPSQVTRRDFLKIAALGSGVLTAASYIPWGKFLIPPRPFGVYEDKPVPIMIEREGGLEPVTINTLPVDSSLFFYYPSKAHWEYTNVLIHLTPEKAKEAGLPPDRAFVAYNRTCIHMRCLVSYTPGVQVINCPCHGSVYRVTDGWPIAGPAALIKKYLPRVKLEIDSEGRIYAKGIEGIIGIGREEA